MVIPLIFQWIFCFVKNHEIWVGVIIQELLNSMQMKKTDVIEQMVDTKYFQKPF